MHKLLRVGLFALPLCGGVAWAQGASAGGSAAAPGSATAAGSDATDDTRTPLQQKAGRIDDTTPALPGDATKPSDIPNTVPESDRSAMPDSATGKPAKPAKPEDATKGEGTKLENKLDQNDSVKDQLNSDK